MNAQRPTPEDADAAPEPLALAARVEPLIFAGRVVGVYMTAGPDHPYPSGALLLRALGVAVNRERAPGIRFRKISVVAANRVQNWVHNDVDLADKSVMQVFGYLTTPSRDQTVAHPHLTAFIEQAIREPHQHPVGAWSRNGFLIGARGPAACQLLDVLAEGSESADMAIWTDPWLRPAHNQAGLAIARPSMIEAYAAATTKGAEAPPADLAEKLMATNRFTAIKRVSVLDARASRTKFNALFTLTPNDGKTPAFTATVEQLQDWLARLEKQKAPVR